MNWKSYPKYKSAKVGWLGRIPAHWEERKLKYAASASPSNVDKDTVEGEKPVRLCNYTDVYKNEYIGSELDFMQATASPAEITKFKVKKGDVLVTKDSEEWRDIAIPAYITSDMNDTLCGYHLAQIRPNMSLMEGEYLFRAFSARGLNDQFRIAANGITRYGLDKYSLDNSLFLIPPIDEQRTIAAFLRQQTKCLDNLITKKQRQIELLEEKRAAFISYAVTRGLNHDVKMKDSGVQWLGEIPEHWEVNRAKVVFREIDVRSSTGQEELLTVSHITGVTPRSEKTVNMFMAENFEGYKTCSAGDLVINTMWAWMGAMGITRRSGIVSPSYNVYRFRGGGQEPKFYDFLFRTKKFISEVFCHSQGVWTSRLRLYPEEFYEIRLPCPPLSEQSQIVANIERQTGDYDILQDKIQQSISRLLEYRTALISAAVTGKIDVRQEAC
jgi:type I restriction enzyme S subunit